MTPPLILIADPAPGVAQVAQVAKSAKALAREARLCSGRLTLTGEGVGVVRVGQPVETVRKACHVKRVTKRRDDEASLERVLEFKIGAVPVVAEIDGGRIWRVTVDGPGLRTQDRLGVGSPLAALLTGGETTAVEGEGLLYATPPAHCGLSFQLSYRPKTGEDRDSWSADALAKLPADTTVTRLLMSGCKGR